MLLAVAPDGTLVAVKVLEASDGEARLRFLNEQQLDVDHPNLVRNLDWLQDRSRSLLVMQYSNAGDLQEWLGSHEQVDPWVAVDVARQLLLGLAQLHDSGVVHRDIKPSNALLDLPAGSVRPTVRISDFGLAVAIDRPRVTQMPTAAGTAGFMAPEVLYGADADQRSDLYSVGVILGMVLDRCSTPHPELTSLAAALVQPEPTDRPQSARSAARFLEGLALVPAWPAEQLPTVAEFDVPPPVAPAAPVASVAPAGAEATPPAPSPATPPPDRADAGAEPDGSRRRTLAVVGGVALAAAALALVLGGGPLAAPEPAAVTQGVYFVAGQDLATVTPIVVDLSRPVVISGRESEPVPESVSVSVRASAGPIQLGELTDPAPVVGPDGAWQATLAVPDRQESQRVLRGIWNSADLSAEMILRDGVDSGPGLRVVPFTVRSASAKPWYATIGGWLPLVFVVGALAVAVANLRALVRGVRLTGSAVGLTLSAAVVGSCLTLWFWTLGGGVLSAFSLALGGLVGALVGIGTSCLAARFGLLQRRRRHYRVVAMVEDPG